jgi:hypothetical protein
VEIRELGEMRGVVATRPIARGSELVRVPRSRPITLETALGRLEERQVRVAELELSSAKARLAVWLLVERGDPRSVFQPYFDALPQRLLRFPINAISADRALLDGSLAGVMLDRRVAELRSRDRRQGRDRAGAVRRVGQPRARPQHALGL